MNKIEFDTKIKKHARTCYVKIPPELLPEVENENIVHVIIRKVRENGN